MPLIDDAYRLSDGQLTPLADSECNEAVARPALLVRRDGGGREQWVLLVSKPSAVRVNGMPPVLGIRALGDRDEILVRDAKSGRRCRCFFSTERPARVEPFRAADGDA